MTIEISKTSARKIFDNALSKDALHIFTGAGISMIPPSTLPSGQKLKEIIVQASTSHSSLKKYYNRLSKNKKYINVVPEIIFQDIYVSLGPKFFNSFSILTNSPSNHIHQTIAYLLDNSSIKNFTTNFDLLVDKNQTDLNKNVHLHGSLNDPQEMTMRIYKIGKGLHKLQELEFLNSVRNKILFVLGYSGNDTDIIELINKSEVQHVIWLMRDSNDSWTLENINRINKHVSVFQDDLDLFFKRIIKTKKIKNKKDAFKKKKSLLTHYSKSLSAFEKHYVLGHLLFRVSDFKNSKEVFKLVLDKGLYRNSNEFLTAVIFYTDTLRVIGDSYLDGINLLKRAYKDNLKSADIIKLGEVKNMIGLLILELDPNPRLKPIAHLNKAIEIFEKAIGENVGSKELILPKVARVYNNMGLCYQESQLNYHKAEFSYKKSIKIKRNIGNYLGLATSMTNYCLLALNQGHKSKYYYWRTKTMKLIEKYKMQYRLSYLLREEGRHFGSKSSIKRAKEKLIRAKDILTSEIPSAKKDIQIIEELIIKYTT